MNEDEWGEEMERNEYDSELDERVARGVAVLDEEVPDWVERIFLPDLNLSSECRCVLGLVFAKEYEEADTEHTDDPYCYGANKLSGDPEDSYPWAVDHGFDADMSMIHGNQFHDLQERWEEVISERQRRALVATREALRSEAVPAS